MPLSRLPPAVPGEVTLLLRSMEKGDPEAGDRLFDLLYDELRHRADRILSGEYRPPTLRPTELVHETYVRMAGNAIPASDRTHFLAISARAMRRVLVDRARRRKAARRGGDLERTTLSGLGTDEGLDPDELIALDQAMQSLEERQRRVVECRFFAGLSEEEVAEVLGVTPRTVRRDWATARAWLYRELYEE